MCGFGKVIQKGRVFDVNIDKTFLPPFLTGQSIRMVDTDDIGEQNRMKEFLFEDGNIDFFWNRGSKNEKNIQFLGTDLLPFFIQNGIEPLDSLFTFFIFTFREISFCMGEKEDNIVLLFRFL